MKKNISFLLLAAFFLIQSQNSFAWTEGHIIGFDVINTHHSIQKKATRTSGSVFVNSEKPREDVLGFGLAYKYAFTNQYGYWFAPGIILEQNSIGSKRVETRKNESDYLQTRNRYGVKADFGYDFNEKFAIFSSVGYSILNYKTKTSELNASSNDIISNTKNGYENSFFYGAGFLYKLNKQFMLNFEYNRQKYSGEGAITNEQRNGTFVGIDSNKINSNLDIFKIGLHYNF